MGGLAEIDNRRLEIDAVMIALDGTANSGSRDAILSAALVVAKAAADASADFSLHCCNGEPAALPRQDEHHQRRHACG
jgi:enolase